MPTNVIPESSWDPTLNQLLITYYRDLVHTEINEPIVLRSSFLGIKLSKKMADDLASSQKLISSLGSSGVFEDGIPFYHMHTQTLSSDEFTRLETNEVRLKTGRFSAGEDDQLRKNWEEYCDVSGVDADEVQFYMGCDQRKKKGSRYFRPWMCRGLPDRSGIQVYRRCQVIFHPANEDNGYTRPWTRDELDILMQLGSTGKWADIGARLNRPRYHCQKQYVSITRQGINVDGEEDKTEKLLYKQITKAIGKDPVRAFAFGQLNELEQTIDWESIGQILSCEPKSCRKSFKRMKRGLEEAKANSRESDPHYLIKTLRKSLPKPCRVICRMQNRRKSKLTLAPKKFSQLIRDLCSQHEEEISTLKKPYKFSKTFIASEALADYNEKSRLAILRRLTYVMSTFQNRGVFDFLPNEHRDLLTKFKLVRYVMKKIYYTRVNTAQAIELAKRFIEKQGWEPKRTALAFKLESKKK